MKKILIASLYVCSMLHAPLAFADPEASAAKGISEVTATSGPAVKDSADQSASKNGTGQVMSVLSGGMLAVQSQAYFATCPEVTSGCVKGAITAAMAIMSMMQAKEHGSAASTSGLTSNLTNGSGDPYGSGSYDPTVLKNPEVVAATNAFNKLKNSGVVKSDGTIKTADGKTYKVSDFASEKSMAAAGIPSGAIKGAMSNAAAISEKALAKAEKIVGKSAGASAEDSFGGGGGGSTTVVTVDDEAGMGGAGKGLGAGLKRDPAQLAGMQKNYNGEPIGVAADSIFLMMNRRYQFKQSQDSFLTEMDLRLQK